MKTHDWSLATGCWMLDIGYWIFVYMASGSGFLSNLSRIRKRVTSCFGNDFRLIDQIESF